MQGIPRRYFAALLNNLVLLLVTIVMLVSCTTTTSETNESKQENVASTSTSQLPSDNLATLCQDPRPEVCTFIYAPVCALRDTGIRCVTTPCDATEWKTYSSGCSACADNTVVGFNADACDSE